MKKTIIALICIGIFYFFISDVMAKNLEIPDDAIRIRVVPNSNSDEDQAVKGKVRDTLEVKMYNLLKDAKNSEDAKEIIEENLESVKKEVGDVLQREKYDKNYQVNFGSNYFPEKEYKGVKYEEGYYESLLVTLGEGKGDDKAVMAVKAAVESPLLETTIAGATDIIINVSGDISMFDASDAVDYVREITGDDVNIIFGAMYDSNQADYCRITVIATGIEETPASRFGTSFARKPITPSVGQTGMKTTVSATGANTTRPYNSALQQPVHPGAASNAELKKPAGINGIQPAPTVLRSKVQERDLKIPDFLQKK